MQLLRITWTTKSWLDTLPSLCDWDKVGAYDDLDLALDDGPEDTRVS